MIKETRLKSCLALEKLRDLGNNSGTDFQASGAYVFRPKDQIPNNVGETAVIQSVSGPVVVEVHVQYSSYASGIIRIYNEAQLSGLENEWLVGPIPVDDNIGS